MMLKINFDIYLFIRVAALLCLERSDIFYLSVSFYNCELMRMCIVMWCLGKKKPPADAGGLSVHGLWISSD